MSEAHLNRCTSCGATNRVPQEKIDRGLAPVCGRCKTPLVIQSTPLTVTDATFTDVVERSPVPVLLDMWAPWCGPCRMMTPVLDELAREMAGKVRVGKLNVDENPTTAAQFKVSSIPTLLIFNTRGHLVDRLVGVQSKAEIRQRLEKLAA